MTRILLDLRHDIPGGTAPLTATLVARRMRIRRDGAVVTYPDDVRFALPGPIDLDPPEPGDAWNLQIWFPDRRDTLYRVVTFTGAQAAWNNDLVDLDPATLNPAVEPPAAAWTAALGGYLKKPTVLTSAAYDALTPAQKAAPVLYLLTD